jgi:hypothetical protein
MRQTDPDIGLKGIVADIIGLSPIYWASLPGNEPNR